MPSIQTTHDAVKAEPANQFWGDRLARSVDPFGHRWLVASRVEDLSPDEIAERVRARFAAAAPPS